MLFFSRRWNHPLISLESSLSHLQQPNTVSCLLHLLQLYLSQIIPFSLHTAVLFNRERLWHCIWQNALMWSGFEGNHHNSAIEPNTMNDVNTSCSITWSISTEFFPLYFWLKQENLRKILKIEWSNFFLYVKDIFCHAPETIDNILAWYFLHFNTSSLRDCHNVVA